MANGTKYDSGKLEYQYLGLTETWWPEPLSRAEYLLRDASFMLDKFWIKGGSVTDLQDTLYRLRAAAAVITPDITFIEGLIQVRKAGAKKYSFLNYRGGMEYSRLVGAARRHKHFYPIVLGEKFDQDSGAPHWAAAACSIAFLLEYVLDGLGIDDRETLGKDLAVASPASRDGFTSLPTTTTTPVDAVGGAGSSTLITPPTQVVPRSYSIPIVGITTWDGLSFPATKEQLEALGEDGMEIIK